MLFVSVSFNSANVFSADYSWIEADWPWFDVLSAPAPEDSARFWRDVMTRHAAESNMRAMTLDTLQGIVYAFADNLREVDRAERMQAGYAAAAAELGIVFRVDCHNAPLAMGALDQPAWVASRVTGDATPGTSGSDRAELAGVAVFMAALHIRPMMDVLWSTSVQPGDPYSASLDSPSLRLNLQRDLALAVLSAGLVGIGDMVGGTDPVLLATALRADSVVLKPAHPLLRLERFYAGADAGMLWAAASVPARSASAALDRRANSLARLTPLGSSNESAAAVWWFSLLATAVTPTFSAPLAPRDLFPPPPPGAAFIAAPTRLAKGSRSLRERLARRLLLRACRRREPARCGHRGGPRQPVRGRAQQHMALSAHPARPHPANGLGAARRPAKGRCAVAAALPRARGRAGARRRRLGRARPGRAVGRRWRRRAGIPCHRRAGRAR